MLEGSETVVKKAFTLIEMMVVMSIISMVASVYMPTLNIARQQAESVLCQNNLSLRGRTIRSGVQLSANNCPTSGKNYAIFSLSENLDRLSSEDGLLCDAGNTSTVEPRMPYKDIAYQNVHNGIAGSMDYTLTGGTNMLLADFSVKGGKGVLPTYVGIQYYYGDNTGFIFCADYPNVWPDPWFQPN
jgi:prepilin-type N-terminal cleavage/methylation domain-containing protein